MLINTIKIMIKKEINVKKYTKRIGQRIDLDGFQITLFFHFDGQSPKYANGSCYPWSSATATK